MERLRPIISVADDGNLHPAINRGIEQAAKVGLTCVDYMIETAEIKQVVGRLKEMHPTVKIGLHVDVSEGQNDYLFTALAYWRRARENSAVQQRLVSMTERQMKKFQDSFGCQPAHVSVHGHLNLDHREMVFPWFVDLMQNLLGGEYKQVLIRGIHTRPVRYLRAREAIAGKRALNQKEFDAFISSLSQDGDPRLLEMIVHPATIRYPSEPRLYAFYSLELRQKDLEAFRAIAQSVSDASLFPENPVQVLV